MYEAGAQERFKQEKSIWESLACGLQMKEWEKPGPAWESTKI